MMLNMFDSDDKTVGSLTISPKLNQTDGSTHVQNGSTHRRRRISNATRDMTEFLLFCSVPGWQEALVERKWTDQWIKESNAPRTQASTRTTTYTDDNNDGTNAEDYNMPDTYRSDWSSSTG